MESIGRYLMIGGVVMFLLGGLLFLSAKFDLLFGRLRGEGVNSSFYFPLTSSILVSVVLTIVLNVIVRLWKK
jgi:hypothetical protein